MKSVITEDISSKIYSVRGLQVMLDRDLANFYDVKAIRLREQIKRNIKRFPSGFMFKLSSRRSLQLRRSIKNQQYSGI